MKKLISVIINSVHVVYLYFGFKGASASKVIGAHNEIMMDDYDGQMIVGDLVGRKLPDIRLTGEEKPRKNLTQETCPDRGSSPGLCVTSARATTCSTAVDPVHVLILIDF